MKYIIHFLYQINVKMWCICTFYFNPPNTAQVDFLTIDKSVNNNTIFHTLKHVILFKTIKKKNIYTVNMGIFLRIFLHYARSIILNWWKCNWKAALEIFFNLSTLIVAYVAMTCLAATAHFNISHLKSRYFLGENFSGNVKQNGWHWRHWRYPNIFWWIGQ